MINPQITDGREGVLLQCSGPLGRMLLISPARLMRRYVTLRALLEIYGGALASDKLALYPLEIDYRIDAASNLISGGTCPLPSLCKRD